MIKLEQHAVFLNNPQEEIANNFKCHIEYLSQSDQAWTTWQFVYSFDDWQIKGTKHADDKTRHHKLPPLPA